MLKMPRTRIARTVLIAAPAMALALGVVLWSADRGDAREEVGPLLATGKTILGQPFAYPAGKPAKVTAVIVTMQPGDQTGWHKHEVPLFAYILEGEVSVDYGAHGTRVYRNGDALMEAIDTAHDGRNTGSGVSRILAVFMGAQGVPNTISTEPPETTSSPPSVQSPAQ